MLLCHNVSGYHYITRLFFYQPTHGRLYLVCSQSHHSSLRIKYSVFWRKCWSSMKLKYVTSLHLIQTNWTFIFLPSALRLFWKILSTSNLWQSGRETGSYSVIPPYSPFLCFPLNLSIFFSILSFLIYFYTCALTSSSSIILSTQLVLSSLLSSLLLLSLPLLLLHLLFLFFFFHLFIKLYFY